MSDLDRGADNKDEIKMTVREDPDLKFESPKRSSAFKAVELRTATNLKSPFCKIFAELEPLPEPVLLKTPKPGATEEMIYLKTPDNRIVHVESKMGERLDFDALGGSTRKHLQTIEGGNSAEEYEQSYEEQDGYQQQAEEQGSSTHRMQAPANNHEPIQQAPAAILVYQEYLQPPKEEKPEKICCNCKKSRCLKLYCECFRNNQLCSGCNCVQCLNTNEHCPQRYNAVINMMQMNPQAFCPKIEMQKHTRGCNCKKSFCLKKYCECYQAGLGCSQLCRCQDCKNTKVAGDPHAKPKSKSKIEKSKVMADD